MDKKTELAVLDVAIAQLGAESYLGPWLSGIRLELEALLRADVLPEITVGGALLQAREIVSKAKLEAEAKTAKASTEGQAIISAARAKAEEFERTALRERMALAASLEETARKIRAF